MDFLQILIPASPVFRKSRAQLGFLSDRVVSQTTQQQPDPSADELRDMQVTSDPPPPVEEISTGLMVIGVIGWGMMIAGASAAAYHGYKRNRGSAGYALGWGLAGLIFPLPTIVVALAQGYGKPSGGGSRSVKGLSAGTVRRRKTISPALQPVRLA